MNRLLLALCLAGVCAVQPACTSTVTPDAVASRQASFDGTAQNSGVIDQVAGGFVVTPRFRARYNAAVEKYGRAWSPALTTDYGVFAHSDGNFLITPEAMEKFLVMNAWSRMGKEAAQ